MFDPQKIPDTFKSEDSIYHYTKKDTAIRHILYDKQLKLSSRLSSVDPLEKSKPIISFSNYGNDEFLQNTNFASKELYEKIKTKIESTRQACFCMNDKSKVDMLKKPTAEYYGFLKPRMWDQYADNYEGVCICFSKNKLIENKDVFNREIEYQDYFNLYSVASFARINEIELNQLGEEDYLKLIDKEIYKYIFSKHCDYQDEKEYRLITNNDKDYYLNIENSIKGIIVSEINLSNYDLEIFAYLAQQLKIKLLFISWNINKIELESYDDISKKMKIFRESTGK